jgi:hypothetical protein
VTTLAVGASSVGIVVAPGPQKDEEEEKNMEAEEAAYVCARELLRKIWLRAMSSLMRRFVMSTGEVDITRGGKEARMPGSR